MSRSVKAMEAELRLDRELGEEFNSDELPDVQRIIDAAQAPSEVKRMTFVLAGTALILLEIVGYSAWGWKPTEVVTVGAIGIFAVWRLSVQLCNWKKRAFDRLIASNPKRMGNLRTRVYIIFERLAKEGLVNISD